MPMKKILLIVMCVGIACKPKEKSRDHSATQSEPTPVTSPLPGEPWRNTSTQPTSAPSGAFGTTPTKLAENIDMTQWMNSELEPGFIEMFAEDFDGSHWKDRAGVIPQLFKMKHLPSSKQLLWRKDDKQDFYGEIFYYDDQFVYLRSETFPIFHCPSVSGVCDPAGTWDDRPDKFRWFAGRGEPMRTARGRVFAPKIAWHGWSHGPYAMDTYYCHSHNELDQSNCDLYQSNHRDWVTVEAYSNYNIFAADGDKVEEYPNAPSPAEKIYDVVIISQEFNPTNLSGSAPLGTVRGRTRERFFLGRLKGKYVGMIRWDLSSAEDGKYKLSARSIGYRWSTDSNVTFEGMIKRAAREK